MEHRQLAVCAAHTYFFHAKQDLIVSRDVWSLDFTLNQRSLLEIQRYGAHYWGSQGLVTRLPRLGERAVQRRLPTGAQLAKLPHNASYGRR